jgi:hypothetical protein
MEHQRTGCHQKTNPRRFYRRLVGSAGLIVATLASGDAWAGCMMQRQCRPAYRNEQVIRYQQQCNTFYFAGRRQTSCQNVPVRTIQPVAYQDCSQVVRVCNDLGSLIGGGRRR